MVTTTPLSGLARALKVQQGELISLVGGGGKTTTLFTLGEQMTGTTILTTTTKMGAEQTSTFPTLIDPNDDELRAALASHRQALAWKAADDRRAIGVSADQCDRWFALADNVVAEADGSRKRPFKAPAQHEPVLPSRTTLLIACIGASALGSPIRDCCHRPELVAALADCTVDDELTPARAAAVLLSTHGSRKGLPADSRFVVVVHRVAPRDVALVEELASLVDQHAPVVAVLEEPTVD